MNNIGTNIAKFRKEKKITQEQLASFVSVSAQAVSKWENGGTPDCELLPKIADCLQVSIDALFSRKCEDNISIKQELAKRILELPVAERFNEVMEYLWVLQLALAGNNGHFSDGNYKKTIKETGDEYRHSQNIFDEGIIMMSLKEKLQYFLCMPEPDDGWLKNLNNIDDYCKLFAFLGEKDFLNAAILLESIEPYLFNISLLKSNLNITEERAEEIISKLKEYKFITEASIETENGKEKVYHIHSNPALVAVLALATELMKKPTNFTHYHNSRNLRKTFKVL
ncbi:MAG: helix-turn-helix transcriptional regulator [Clostridia bacterium]|nr:helix-turn-helix transcriptional regulator [Clostridia bacterium]